MSRDMKVLMIVFCSALIVFLSAKDVKASINSIN